MKHLLIFLLTLSCAYGQEYCVRADFYEMRYSECSFNAKDEFGRINPNYANISCGVDHSYLEKVDSLNACFETRDSCVIAVINKTPFLGEVKNITINGIKQ